MDNSCFDFLKKYNLDKKFKKLDLVLRKDNKNNNFLNTFFNKKYINEASSSNTGKIFKKKFVFVSGPCSIENEKQALTIAEKLVKIGVDIFRGGIFKPRTSPYDFQGLEEKGLKILLKVKETFNIPVITEAITIEHLHLLKDKVDFIQIGARNMFNYPLLKEAGKIDKPILLKRANNATYYELLSAAEYILVNGNSKVILCERGIRTFENATRNTIDIAAIPFLKKITNLPVFFDPSHGTGISELIEPITLAGASAGADGVVIEVHNNPVNALSDKLQQITCEKYAIIYKKVNKILHSLE